MKYLILIGLMIAPALLYAADDGLRDTRQPGYSLYILEDKEKSLAIADITSREYEGKFTRLAGGNPDFGFTSSTYWGRIALNLPAGDWVLEVRNPWLCRVSLYLPRPDGSYSRSESGSDLPFSTREIKTRHIAFHLKNIGQRPVTCYLRVESDNYKVIFPLSIVKTETFMRSSSMDKLVFGIYMGIIGAMFFYNLFIFFSLRERAYLYYVLSILCFGTFQTIISGYAHEILWPESPWFNRIVFFMPCCGILLGSPFVSRYLRTRDHAPRINAALRWVSLSGWPLMVSGFLVYLRIVPAQTQFMLLALAYLSLAVTIVWAAAICLIKKYSPAKYAFIAFAGYMGGMLVFSLMATGIIPGEYHSRIYIQQATTAIGLLLLSLGLADRINIMRREQERERLAAHDTELRFRDSQIRSQRLELELLKKTIQPHFVMNTLTAVRSWLLERPEKAVRLIDALANELRPIISHSSMKLISLRDEINLCRSHLEVMGLRLDREYELNVTGATGNETVPPLIFHTMVENAFTHGDPYLFSRFSIERVSMAGGCRFVFTVDAAETESGAIREGTGIRYIRTRLEESYPCCWDLTCGQAGGLWRVIIDIREDA